MLGSPVTTSARTLDFQDKASPLCSASSPSPRLNRSTPVTAVQDDADLQFAQLLQEQERMFFMLQAAPEVADPGDSLEAAASPLTPEADDDATYARLLQQQEDDETYRQLYALQAISIQHLNESSTEVDVDAMSYADLTTLGEIAGTVNRGLPPSAIASLPKTAYCQLQQDQCHLDKCCVCQLEFMADDQLTLLPCSHYYHEDCIATWLGINKVCPVCNAELPVTSMHH
ncbi:RING-type domain-containing protein, partial [Haematococcus lacustris]